MNIALSPKKQPLSLWDKHLLAQRERGWGEGRGGSSKSTAQRQKKIPLPRRASQRPQRDGNSSRVERQTFACEARKRVGEGISDIVDKSKFRFFNCLLPPPQPSPTGEGALPRRKALRMHPSIPTTATRQPPPHPSPNHPLPPWGRAGVGAAKAPHSDRRKSPSLAGRAATQPRFTYTSSAQAYVKTHPTNPTKGTHQ